MRLTILFLAACGALFAQNPNPCSQITNTATAGQVLSANNGGSTPPCSWITNGGGGGGTVTNVSAGTLSPLFTTTVTNPTTTPSIAFNLSNTNNNTFLGNVSGGSAGWAAVTNTAVTAALNQFTNTLQGLVPGSGGGTTNFLRADGTWAAPSGGSGTVTSVSFTGGLISVATPTTTPALTVAGTSGGIPYFSGSATWASSGALTGIVRGGSPPTAAELSGDATTSGSNAVTVVKVNGVSHPANPSTNTVPVVTSSNTVTYEAVPNAALANSSITVNGTTCTLGSTCSPAGLVLIEQHTASTSAELDFTTCISSTYDEYQVEFINLVPTTAADNILMQVHAGGSYDTGNNYSWATFRSSDGGNANAGSAGTSSFGLDGAGGQSNSSTLGGFIGRLQIYSPGNGAFHPRVAWNTVNNDGSGNPDVAVKGGGSYLSTTAVDGFRIKPTGTNTLASGTVRCYGISK